jgi:hypothetical protein
MKVRMEHTRGLGREAEVWVKGSLLTVCDGISAPNRRTPPGPLENVRLRYTNDEAYSWADAIRRNPQKRITLEPVRSWAYRGFGRVEQVMPVVIHFGLLRLEDPNWETAEDLVGKYVCVPIDKLELVPAKPTDYPEDAR